MERGRTFAHIFEINSLEVKAYLLPGTDSLVQSHLKGISRIARIGSYVIVSSAGTKLVGVVTSLHVMEPEKLYWLKTKPNFPDKQIIRTIEIILVGQFYTKAQGMAHFERGISSYPSIDEPVMATTQEELDLILSEAKPGAHLLEVGLSYPTNDIRIRIDPVKLFSRHCAVVGSTGNGKSCTVTVILREILAKSIQMPVFIFDINGEYAAAFKSQRDLAVVKFCGDLPADHPRKDRSVKESVRLNYASFSRTTLRSVLKPSEKTQLPALNFAFDCLPYLALCLNELEIPKGMEKFVPDHLKRNPGKHLSSFLSGDPAESDPNKLREAYDTLQFLAIATAREIERKAKRSVYMSFLSRIVSDRWGIVPKRGSFEYDGFRYGNVATLCERINELCRDGLFRKFCDTTGQEGIDVNEIMGESGKEPPITVLDLSMIPQEYIAIVVDAILEQQLLCALQGHFLKQPHLLVLDEAHHYLGRRLPGESEAVYLSNPPGERIAKEGRKYGLHMLVSSQRPRELAHTIMAQIGTVISHALTHSADRDVVSGFGTYNDRTILDALSVLPRREAIMLGQAISMPTRFRVDFLEAAERPSSHDPLEAALEHHREVQGVVVDD